MYDGVGCGCGVSGSINLLRWYSSSSSSSTGTSIEHRIQALSSTACCNFYFSGSNCRNQLVFPWLSEPLFFGAGCCVSRLWSLFSESWQSIYLLDVALLERRRQAVAAALFFIELTRPPKPKTDEERDLSSVSFCLLMNNEPKYTLSKNCLPQYSSSQILLPLPRVLFS